MAIRIYRLKPCNINEIIGKKLLNVQADSESYELFFENSYAIEFDKISGEAKFGKVVDVTDRD